MTGACQSIQITRIATRIVKISGAILASLLAMGCSTPGKGLNVFAPYRGATVAEEYRSPPPEDTRFTQAPSYPAALLKPVVKVKDEESGTGLRRAPIGGGGMMPNMPGSAGGY